MANLVYKRVSTDQQSTDRQNLVLAEAGIEDPVTFEEEAGTSSRLHPLDRPKFGELLTYARPGDVVHISEMFRLARGTRHILDVLEVLHHDQVAPRIHDGAFSPGFPVPQLLTPGDLNFPRDAGHSLLTLRGRVLARVAVGFPAG
ncbi:recombinase family protein [Streptomyces sp. NBC_00841]|uniref:recombinase family protein n=1 Tax=Streptomyces sp. NBC_00841 TaxID=2975847 RepID=UPI003FA374A4